MLAGSEGWHLEHWLPGLFLPAPGKAGWGSVRLWIDTAQNNLKCHIPTHYLPENQRFCLLLLAEAMASDRLIALRMKVSGFLVFTPMPLDGQGCDGDSEIGRALEKN